MAPSSLNFFEAVLNGPSRIEKIEWTRDGPTLLARISFGDLICSHAGLVHGGVIGAVLVQSEYQ